MSWIEVTTTVGQLEIAKKMARILVEEQLAACVQIDGPLTSIYRWQGSIHEDQEFRCTIKTRSRFYERVRDLILVHHPYDTPEILSFQIRDASAAYEEWLDQQLPETTLTKQFLRIYAASQNGRSLSADRPDTRPFGICFEEFYSIVSAWPNMHLELDGSMVWVSLHRDSRDVPHWQLDGMIYDRGDAIEYVEIKGNCDPRSWKQLLAALRNSVSPTTLIAHDVASNRWIIDSELVDLFGT